MYQKEEIIVVEGKLCLTTPKKITWFLAPNEVLYKQKKLTG